MKIISFIFGTRPEAIKLCPLILSMKKKSEFHPHVCVTGQHREMLDQVLNVFDVVPDVDLKLMQPNQTLAGLASKSIAAIDAYLCKYKPEMVIVQGDTTTVLCAALCAFYRQIPVGHVEAGLRTRNKYSPFPEEINRVLATKLSDFHFTPTKASRDNLIMEGVNSNSIYITGNTVIDALFIAIDKVNTIQPEIPELPFNIFENGKSLVLITGHRRENFGKGFDNICNAIVKLSKLYEETVFIYPVHLNPNVRLPVYNRLGRLSNVYLIKPQSYLPFVALMNKATLILTDSGGVQEEAPSLGKPVLVMRDNTERLEAVEAGTVKLVGANCEAIVSNMSSLLTDNVKYNKMAKTINPYGDGKACSRIIAALRDRV